MDILEELRQLQQQHAKPSAPTTSDSYISDAVTYSALYRAGVDEATINEVLAEPVESREWYIQYFEGKKNEHTKNK